MPQFGCESQAFYKCLAPLLSSLLPKVDSTNDDDTQGGILESNQAAPAKAGNATVMNRTETKPNKNKAKLKDTDLIAES